MLLTEMFLTDMLSKTMETDPKAVWKTIHELKNESLPSDKAEKINRTQWYSHFRDLLKIIIVNR